jgi:hypothetical protein
MRQVDNAGLDDVQAVEEAGDVLTAAQLALISNSREAEAG